MASTQALILDIFGTFLAGYFACNKEMPSNQILGPFLEVGWLTTTLNVDKRWSTEWKRRTNKISGE